METKEANPFMKKMIHEKGKQYYSAILPKEIVRGKVGDCFDYCLAIAVILPKYRYVEGIAMVNVGTPTAGFIHHAWLTDEEGLVAYDPTWRADREGIEMPMPAHYIGVLMHTDKVMEFVTKTEYKAVLENYWRDEELAKSCIC